MIKDWSWIIEDLITIIILPVSYIVPLKPTISVSENSVQHDRIKHMEIDTHFIKNNLEPNVVLTGVNL